MRDYIPRDEARRIEWMSSFAQFLNAHGADYGFSSGEIAAFVAALTNAKTAFSDNVTQQDLARAATVSKNAALAVAMGLSRKHAQRLQYYPGMTDGVRALAGLTLPDTNPTPTPPDEILTIPAPLIRLDFSMRNQVSIHWGPNPANEQRNARPKGTRGCQIQAARGGRPEDERDWMDLGLSTRSPHIHTVHEDTPTTYAYRARYIGRNQKYGPFGNPVVCTVNV